MRNAMFLLVTASVLVLSFCIPPNSQASAAAPAGHRGKPGAAVDLRFDASHSLTAGVPAPLAIVMVPGSSADEASIDFVPSAGLRISGRNSLRVTRPLKDEAYPLTVTVVAEEDGIYHLGIIARLRHGHATESRTVSLRVQVGDSKEVVRQSNQAADKAAIVEMPAIESAR